MTTAGYKPAFIALSTQFANSHTQGAVAANPSLPPVYIETVWWPLSMASQNPSTEEPVTTMHHPLHRAVGPAAIAPAWTPATSEP